MKIFILFLILLISPIELRRPVVTDDDTDIYELSDLFKDRYGSYKHRPDPSFGVDETNGNVDEDNDDDDDDDDNNQDFLSSFQRTKTHPTHKKVLPDNDSDKEDLENEDTTTTRKTPSLKTTTIDSNDKSDPSVCVEKYDIQSEQLVKVKELTNGAHMIRYVLVDKRILPPGVTVKDSCMRNCCAEKSCDLAMLSEQPTHNGYKCYLFACNGSCILASHQDYTVMSLKTNTIAKTFELTSTSTNAPIVAPQKGSFFRETSVIIFLVFGLVSTIILLILLICQCRQSRRRGLKFKNYSVDEDYLINGLYL